MTYTFDTMHFVFELGAVVVYCIYMTHTFQNRYGKVEFETVSAYGDVSQWCKIMTQYVFDLYQVKQALRYFGPLTVPQIIEKLGMRGIPATSRQVEDSLQTLIRMREIRTGDPDGIFVTMGHTSFGRGAL